MYFDAKGLIDFCGKHKITVEQFTLMYLHHIGAKEEKKKKEDPMALLYQYCEQVRPFPKELMLDLEKRGYVIDLNKGKDIYPDNLMISEKFTADVVLFLKEEPNELFDTFPGFVYLEGKRFQGKTMSPEELELCYLKKLKRSKSTHKEVMKALREQIENGTVGMGLKKWFETEQWKREDNEMIDVTDDI